MDEHKIPSAHDATPSAPSDGRYERSAAVTPHGGWALLVVTLALMSGAVWAVYGCGISAPFVFDDLPTIEDNPSIVSLWPLRGSSDGAGPLRPPRDFSTRGRPLVNLSFALNYRAGGLDPRGYHFVNVVLHVFAAMLLFAVIRRTLELPYFGGRFASVAGFLAVAVALLWAVHPLLVDAIEYVTQRTELTVSLCYLATLYASLRYFTALTSRSRAAWLLTAAVACLAGMASKEVMVTAPVVVLLFERTFIAGSFRQALRGSWPLYLALAASWGLLAALNFDGPRSATAGFHLGVPPHVWWCTQAQVLLMYLKLAVWPYPLVIHYEVPYLDTIAAAWRSVAAVAILGVATLALLWRRPAAGFLLDCVLLILSPTLVVPIISESAAERRMYLPLAALVTLAVVGLYAAVGRAKPPRGAAEPSPQPSSGRAVAIVSFAAAMLALAIALGIVASRRVEIFNDPVALWQDAALHQPHDYRVQNNLGVALVDAGLPQDALAHYEEALRLHHDYPDAESNLGVALVIIGQPQEAIAHFERALSIDPDYADAHVNLAHLLAQRGQAAESIDHYRRALKRKPTRAEWHGNLGHVLTGAGQPDEAIAEFEEALRLKPDLAEAHLNLGSTLAAAGRFDDAIAHYEDALRAQPDFVEAHNYLGVALVGAGRPTDAIPHYEEAIRLQPDNADAHNNWGVALFNLNQLDEGLSHFEEAVRLKPGPIEYANLAFAYAQAGRHLDAMRAGREALALAREEGQTDLAARLEAWLAEYRERLRRP